MNTLYSNTFIDSTFEKKLLPSQELLKIYSSTGTQYKVEYKSALIAAWGGGGGLHDALSLYTFERKNVSAL